MKLDNKSEYILILFFIISVIVFVQLKLNPKKPFTIKDYEKKIISTISKNKIIDETFFNGLEPEDLKIGIRNEIVRMNSIHRFKFDLEKMNELMETLEIENLKKLYQWFLYKGSPKSRL